MSEWNDHSQKLLAVSELSRDEKSFILYAESCCVDGCGLLVGARMNKEDHDAAKRFVELGYMHFGRIPAELLKAGQFQNTHWCILTDKGWELAHMCRRSRADNRGQYATEVFSHPITLDKIEAQS